MPTTRPSTTRKSRRFCGDSVVPGPATRRSGSLASGGCGDSAWADPPVYTFRTYADDIDALVHKLELRDFVLVGHSMGGMVALNYAATHPGRVGKLVVVP